MWLSEQSVRPAQKEKDGNIAVVTLPGPRAAAQSGSELRGLCGVSPGGVFWSPEASQEVVTMVCGSGETVILGALMETCPELQAGEVCLRAGGSEVFLRKDGTITLRGRVNVEGALTVEGKPVLVAG